MRLEGKKALVTGAGAGLGRGIAIALAREGAAVAVNDLAKEAGERVVGEIRAAGGTAHFVGADVSREAEVQRMTVEGVEREAASRSSSTTPASRSSNGPST